MVCIGPSLQTVCVVQSMADLFVSRVGFYHLILACVCCVRAIGVCMLLPNMFVVVQLVVS